MSRANLVVTEAVIEAEQVAPAAEEEEEALFEKDFLELQGN